MKYVLLLLVFLTGCALNCTLPENHDYSVCKPPETGSKELKWNRR